jgi:hypothetical protein
MGVRTVTSARRWPWRSSVASARRQEGTAEPLRPRAARRSARRRAKISDDSCVVTSMGLTGGAETLLDREPVGAGLGADGELARAGGRDENAEDVGEEGQAADLGAVPAVQLVGGPARVDVLAVEDAVVHDDLGEAGGAGAVGGPLGRDVAGDPGDEGVNVADGPRAGVARGAGLFGHLVEDLGVGEGGVAGALDDEPVAAAPEGGAELEVRAQDGEGGAAGKEFHVGGGDEALVGPDGDEGAAGLHVNDADADARGAEFGAGEEVLDLRVGERLCRGEGRGEQDDERERDDPPRRRSSRPPCRRGPRPRRLLTDSHHASLPPVPFRRRSRASGGG